MDEGLHILLADYVPMANKGEEAIVRGIEDMLSDGRPVTVGLFDNVSQVVQRENITIFPRRWLFRFEGHSARPAGERILVQVKIALQLRAGIYGPLKNLTPTGAARCKPLQEFFERADYVLAGHDGVFCVESCGIIHLAKRHGKRVGIVGASAGIAGGRLYKAWLYRRAMAESDFCVFRERYSRESMRRVCRDPARLVIGPDPAFAMRPAPPEAAREIQGSGAELVCVSLGENGALLVDADNSFHCDAPKVRVHSTVGCGAAMVAGMVFAAAHGKSPEAMLQLGVICGSATASHPGTGLFTREEVEDTAYDLEIRKLDI